MCQRNGRWPNRAQCWRKARSRTQASSEPSAGALLVERFVGFGDQAALQHVGPIGAERGGEVGTEPVGKRLLSSDGRDAEQDAIVAGR